MSAAVGCVGKNFQSSLSLKLEEKVSLSAAGGKVIEKQGIVSILGSDCERTKAAASLRRTLSADMSSKKWLAQNGFRPMKKIASSEELAISTADRSFSSSSEHEYDDGKDELRRPGQDEVWRSIQLQKEKHDVQNPNGWTWGSILTQKNEEPNELQPAYIHPLLKKSASSLSDKSLEICTESLGSETGSDGFSSYPPSEAGDLDEEKEDGQPQQQSESLEDLEFVKYNYSPNRKMLPKSFPPPLPSLAHEDGASLHMQCHRQNGRLVLEAVSVPSQNYFHAQRQDGRLLLTLLNIPTSQLEARNEEMEDEVEEYARVFDNIEEEIEENEAEFEDDDDGYDIEGEEDDEDFESVEEVIEEKFERENGKRSEMEFVLDQNTKFPCGCGGGGMINVHKSALVMKKLMALNNKNLTWSPKFNKAVNLIGVEELEEDALAAATTTQLPQSLPLPPPPRAARLISTTAPPPTAASFNAYEYFWRQKPSKAGIIKQIPPPEQCTATTTPIKNNINHQNKGFHHHHHHHEQQNLVIMRGNKAEYLLRRCNEPRKSLLLWEPYCIATS